MIEASYFTANSLNLLKLMKSSKTNCINKP